MCLSTNHTSHSNSLVIIVPYLKKVQIAKKIAQEKTPTLRFSLNRSDKTDRTFYTPVKDL